MSEPQLIGVRKFLEEFRGKISLAAHGNCTGADVEFHRMVRRICPRHTYVVVFPSTSKTRAADPKDADYIAPPKSPLERDKDIVRQGHDLLLATPLQMRNELRSGTWATIRYASKLKVKLYIVLRDGTVATELPR